MAEEIDDVEEIYTCCKDSSFSPEGWQGFDGLNAVGKAVVRNAIASYRKD